MRIEGERESHKLLPTYLSKTLTGGTSKYPISPLITTVSNRESSSPTGSQKGSS